MSTGISDDAAVAEHDLIERAEAEEQRLHPKDSMTEDPSQGLGGQSQPSSSNTGQGKDQSQQTKLGKVKETLLGKK